MSKIKVIVREQNILELAEDAKKGDVIDLSELTTVDSLYIKKIIEAEKDKVYEAKFEKDKRIIEENNRSNIEKYKNEINALKKEVETVKNEITSKLKIEHLTEVNEYKNKISKLESDTKFEISNAVSKKENELNKLINDLKIEINNLKNEKEANSSLLEAKLGEQKAQLEADFAKEKSEISSKHNDEVNELRDTINKLNRAKASLHTKQTGEDLEAWCDNEVNSYMQNGLLNCKWFKDNISIKEEGETKGTKADYIFQIFKDSSLKDGEILNSVCLEMKDENPDSKTTQENSKYYKTLDSNRTKKGCKIALLVSNLEQGKANDIPIYKVKEYSDMYVVRPAYMMVFLNLVVSMTNKFADIIRVNEGIELNLKEKQDIINAFNELKNTYLDKPLAALEKDLEAIRKQADNIQEAAKKINESCDHIAKSYIREIEEKLHKFEIKSDKEIVKKLA